MAGKKRSRTPKKFLYFFLNNKIHKVLKRSRARDELIAWCYPDKKRVLYSYSQVEKNMQNAYTTKETAELLNKHKVTIEEYILQGKVKEPQRVYPIGNPDSKWNKFMFSESDILDIHQFIIDIGYSKNVPSKAELQALLKHNMILYTKTEEGGFVPVWKAD
jgi:ribosomal protein L25 (general stress protein Ctc)